MSWLGTNRSWNLAYPLIVSRPTHCPNIFWVTSWPIFQQLHLLTRLLFRWADHHRRPILQVSQDLPCVSHSVCLLSCCSKPSSSFLPQYQFGRRQWTVSAIPECVRQHYVQISYKFINQFTPMNNFRRYPIANFRCVAILFDPRPRFTRCPFCRSTGKSFNRFTCSSVCRIPFFFIYKIRSFLFI